MQLVIGKIFVVDLVKTGSRDFETLLTVFIYANAFSLSGILLLIISVLFKSNIDLNNVEILNNKLPESENALA